jgi:F-type H+-transporting ATPase subunit b
MRLIRIFLKNHGVVLLSLLLITGDAFAAAEQESSWRGTYDVIMLWVNFLIFIVLLYKLLKRPIMDFIEGQKYQIQKELKKAEEDKKLALEKIKESKQMLEEGKGRYERIREMIIKEGERKRQQIIQEAEAQSKFMIEDAKRKVSSQIYHAKKTLELELLDEAFDLAEKRLSFIITDQDNQRFLENFLQSAG